ncbi:MAG: hypothetical protein EOM68_04075, partial [Spirochaetia bacterium]|nr:hypothetical protein [Spirochaetia bacterium]
MGNKRWVKTIVVLVILGAMVILPLASAIHTSIPVDHRVYRILDVAEIRGLIERQVAARPFSAKKVMALLSEIQGQEGKLSAYEKQELASLLQEFESSYGFAPSPLSDVLSTGFFRTYDPDTKIGASMGINLATTQTFSVVSKEYDSRNSLFAFLKGDLGEDISFTMNFGLLVDRLNNNVFLPTDFTIQGEGFYLLLGRGGKQISTIPTAGFYTGLALSPELSATYFDGAVNLRWGSIKRDWGPGLNNIQLSGSARAIEGIELQVALAPWLHFIVLTGSLGKFSVSTIGEGSDKKLFFSDYFTDDKPYYRFENNFSAQRIEFNPTKDLTLSLYESVVWQKRFELGYLNPLSVYMFQQNNLGDIDNMLAGLDFNYTLANSIRLYGGIGASELNKIGSLKAMITAPRNMLAFQAGITVPLPIGSFSSVTFQWTYLAPFFYSHYPMREQVGMFIDPTPLANSSEFDSFTSKRNNSYTISGGGITVTYQRDGALPSETIPLPTTSDSTFSKDGRIEVARDRNGDYLIYETYSETAYVNKGENIGYPLNPNSQEFLLQLDLGLAHGWTTQSVVKYQVRSGQYGYSIEQFYDYLGPTTYVQKDFWGNTFEHSLTVEMQVTKKFDRMPIEVHAQYRFTTVWE